MKAELVQRLTAQLGESQDNVQALVKAALETVSWYRHGADWKELDAICSLEDALARPGVQRVLETSG